MKKLMCLMGAALIACAGIAQDEYDPDAKAVLDKLSKKTSAYTSITTKFKSSLKNVEDGINISEEGGAIIKGSKYVFELGTDKFLFNGKEGWQYDGEMNEAFATCDNEDVDDIFKDPSKIFTMYEEGFKYSYLGLSGDTHKIKLYPEDAGDASYHTIEMHVSESKMQITKMVIYGKDGNTYTYEITSFESNKTYDDATFEFDEDDYPGVEVYDDC